MDLERLVTALAPLEVRGGAPVDVTDLAYDARAVVPGALFFCVPGQRADGHDFASEAVERGAAALVVERPLDLRVPQLVVTSPRRAMPVAADEFFERPTEELLLAGVTGTTGKTTTTFLLWSIFEAAGMKPGLIGTIESRVGGEARPAVRTTPEAIDLQRSFRAMLDAGDRSCVMEATSHGSELGRLERVRFKALAFTNLSQDHLDFHESMDSYFDAKRRLFTEHEPAPAAAVNVGTEWGRTLADELRRLDRAPVLTYGTGPDADLSAHPALEHSRLVGSFNVENVLAGAALSRLLGIPDEAVVEGVAAVSGVPGRFEAVDEGQPFTVIVDYSHKPGALEAVLHTARELTKGGRLICVFGAGGDRDRGKRPIMGRVATELADLTIVTSDNPRSEEPLAIIEEILAGVVGPAEVESDRRAAIAKAIGEARAGDVVVIAGRGAERYQDLAGRRIPFDDREVAREELRRLRAPA
jgi:UDP-N-acetylmuramoyl-L-alanyl-D-glutamate--2,6-diaminopimelate ligase